MPVDFIALFGTAIIAIAIFTIIVALADRPVKALLVALMSSYSMFFALIYLLNRIAKRKETGSQE